ncbi:hypothetical protein IRP63_14610 (plasmid) [Clostridium botulinum]|uniref:hypothetical protein n=1 Tax=Clostridium botulinum TaxID=1491 RepID=UPI00057FCF61|nr:hypothetical protein [Clostridium botulinum]MCD3234815.1 hypothetical protein [Clostridium botulinum D/C]MCD3240950.1 hypothetical protein [Clostridium botulinum D/C]MCD3268189.1 hypothetical protein [Clostridium botulinum D/C]MCD3300979.1 hypothetical protein [Clostridium botulinum D/C]MCD3306565.1 hypothetical protein [Clostridium botulinum D/C]
MEIKKWTSFNKKRRMISKIGVGKTMENVIQLQAYNQYNYMDNECECDVIADIFQRAIKRKGLTKEEVSSISKEMLSDVRKNR